MLTILSTAIHNNDKAVLLCLHCLFAEPAAKPTAQPPATPGFRKTRRVICFDDEDEEVRPPALSQQPHLSQSQSLLAWGFSIGSLSAHMI